MPVSALVPFRPDITLLAILGYAFLAFAIGLLLTPWFIAFLRRNKLGKQLRVETVDGQEPTIFRKYHEAKMGTPTMGGLLIWGSIVITVLASRVLSYFGIVENSLLQRGQVYLPLFMLVSLGILGAIDDYLNIIGTSDEKLHAIMPKLKAIMLSSLLLLIPFTFYALHYGSNSIKELPYGIIVSFGLFGPIILLGIFLYSLVLLGVSSAIADDILKHIIVGKINSRGLGVLQKLFSLLFLSAIGGLWFYAKLDYNSIHIPFLGSIHVGWWYVPIFVFIIIATANAVNVTDGLDGLAGGLLVIAFLGFSVLAFISGLSVLAAFCAVCAGAVAAFLWHNVPPALFFMGDTGSLALGGTLGVIALMIDHVLVLPLIGFVFVIEMLSVILQLTSKRLRGGKKIFRAAPLHHHFEALEWGESKVTMRLWIIGAFFAIFGILLGVLG